jgi:lipid II:glycine glycyltransferase (peptidoglycan interpeptide bridge formation enzyme)
MEIVQSLDEGLWRDFIDRHPDSTIFHTPEMFQVFAQTRRYEPELWAVRNGTTDVLALMTPVCVHIMGGLFRRLTTRSIVYGGVLYEKSTRGHNAVRLLLEEYEKYASAGALYTEFRNHTVLDEIRPLLSSCGYHHEDHLNYLIPLDRPIEEIFNRIGRRTRKRIRKGLRSGNVEIHEVTRSEELAGWYETLQKTYRRARVPLADRSLFDSVLEVLYPRGMANFLSAQVADAIGACSLELIYKDTIYGWYGGTDRAFSKVWPNEMLTWHVLDWGVSNGYRLYDFGGAGKPGEEYGVRLFKAKFGGELVNFGRFVNVHKPLLLKISKPGYQIFQKMR